MEHNQLILSAKDVNIQFNLRGKVLHAIRGIDLDLYQGEVLAIVGESGSGKSVFTKSFMGVNAISVSSGLSTPDQNEASVKAAVVRRSKKVYILADHSKFDQITSVTFASLDKVTIITDKLTDSKFSAKATIKEVM